ncbi:MAG TPA: hypothetical protein VG222_19680 [Vicinamibacterales bacterium]|jgi:hypothetical protein|nr:hypothetical protein [Vicinamibacterales bacterium]
MPLVKVAVTEVAVMAAPSSLNVTEPWGVAVGVGVVVVVVVVGTALGEVDELDPQPAATINSAAAAARHVMGKRRVEPWDMGLRGLGNVLPHNALRKRAAETVMEWRRSV